ncbi:MAG: hypothetical protein M1829_000768 [Trizodia sp. TS-e1964]|nr:MAG: hypothetical protein M1829_000768 [Trizodia sp. TS-e1964]
MSRAARHFYKVDLGAKDHQPDVNALVMAMRQQKDYLETEIMSAPTSNVTNLATGAYGRVFLWRIFYGDNETDLVVVKDADEDEFFLDYCSEAELTRRLNVAGSENVVKILDWALLPVLSQAGKRQHSIFYEYCEYGSLHNLMCNYRTNRLVFSEVFLGEPSLETLVHDRYPTIKLEDFGLALTVPKESVRMYKSWDMFQAGTPGYKAPELDCEVQDVLQNRLIGTHSDIYVLGEIVQELCDVFADSMNRHTPTKAGAMCDFSKSFYSEDLWDLTMRCKRIETLERISPYELYTKAQERLAIWHDEQLEQQKRHNSLQSKIQLARSNLAAAEAALKSARVRRDDAKARRIKPKLVKAVAELEGARQVRNRANYRVSKAEKLLANAVDPRYLIHTLFRDEDIKDAELDPSGPLNREVVQAKAAADWVWLKFLADKYPNTSDWMATFDDQWDGKTQYEKW